MKKILFITTRNPYSGRYSGDVIRALKVIKYLKKKNIVDVVYLTKKKDHNKKLNEGKFFFASNLLLKIIYCLNSLIKINPIQFGIFFSAKMKNFIEQNSNRYDLLFFHHIRSSQYLPSDFKGKLILEMGDLYSKNYYLTYKNLNFLNPLKYIYLLESYLVKKKEMELFSKFDRIILYSKNEIKTISNKFKKKIYFLTESIDKINKDKFVFSKKNNKIIFIGNLNYLPNILACKEFIYSVIPRLVKFLPDLKFYVIGNIKLIDKFILSFNKNVKILGEQKNIERYMGNSICGISNLRVASGVQGKILTYMSFGLPVICSKQTAANFNKSVVRYNNNGDLIKKILLLKNNKKISLNYSIKSKKMVKKLTWNKLSPNYSKVIKF